MPEIIDKAQVANFEKYLRKTKREGIENLIEFIKKSDFYTAPASTRYHSSCPGGLLQHSINVYECLLNKKKTSTLWSHVLEDIEEESLIIIALLHDICKTYFYTTSWRNAKNEETGKWEKVPYYTVEDKIPYGHGEKSVMMIEEYIKLKPIERYAIRWHMGFTEPKENYNSLSAAITKYPIILAMHEADLEATYVLENQ